MSRSQQLHQLTNDHHGLDVAGQGFPSEHTFQDFQYFDGVQEFESQYQHVRQVRHGKTGPDLRVAAESLERRRVPSSKQAERQCSGRGKLEHNAGFMIGSLHLHYFATIIIDARSHVIFWADDWHLRICLAHCTFAEHRLP